MFEKVQLNICFHIIAFSINRDGLKDFIDKKSLASARLKIAKPFLDSCIPLFELINEKIIDIK